MKKAVPALSIIFYLLALPLGSFSQTIPVDATVIENYIRDKQIRGKEDVNESFTIRPFYPANAGTSDVTFLPADSFYKTARVLYKNEQLSVSLLPITLRQQYNTHHPYGWNDGSMIPSKGYQNQLSFGLYYKMGPLSIQFQPEIVYAQNSNFSTLTSFHNDSLWKSYYSTVLNLIDAPEKYGDGQFTKFFPGQSSIRLNFGKLSFGVSTENLWWGPGIRNSLIMSNNAPGFKHISFNTTSPVHSPIGSFEWQMISGILDNSKILPPDTAGTFNGQKLYDPKKDDSKYLNGIIVTWQPKWTKGLYLGFSRLFYLYKSDVQPTFGGYLPVIGKFFKGNNGLAEDALNRDQMLSVFFRLLLPKEKAEVYAEFGRNDHSQNFFDLLLEPEHSRALVVGLRKIFETGKSTDLELMTEFTNLQIPSTSLVREQNSWYSHYQVRHGYTHLGQVVGAGIGPGGNSQTLMLNWIKGIQKFGFGLERVVHNNDFYYNAFASSRNFQSHWVDLSIGLNKSWHHKKFLYAAHLSWIRSFNYQWQFNKDVNNFQANLAISYLF